MSATIKRGAPVRRPPPRRKPQRRPLAARLLDRLPLSEAMLRRLGAGAVLLAGGAVLVVAGSVLGVPAMVAGLADEAAARAGLRVEQIEVTGLKRMDLMTVNAVALDQKSLAMPAVDLAGVRDRLMRYGWVADAHVSRRLPDTLLIRIDERTPAAVWQHDGQLMLVDASGVLLEPVDPDRMPDLPLVIGPGADRQEPAYQALLSAAPALRPRVKAASWVGNRRWDLTFTTGETLALPEGEREAAVALGRFAQLVAQRPILGRGWMHFDLRDPARLVARRPGSAAQALTDGGAGASPAMVGRAEPPDAG